MEMESTNDIVITLYSDYTYDEYWGMCRIVESLCCTLETNITYVNYTSVIF